MEDCEAGIVKADVSSSEPFPQKGTSLIPCHVYQSSLEALDELKFDKMTPVQAETVPAFIDHKDVVVEAVTGSGKTLAFVIPIMEMLRRRREEWGRNQIGAIIITPTRELAIQIHNVIKSMKFELPSACFIGGNNSNVSQNYEKFIKEQPKIIVATPGRLWSLISEKRDIVLRELEVLVLDEADRLLSMGFERTLRDIFNMLPKQRRTGLFSATMTDGLEGIVRAGLRNPVRIAVHTTNVKTGETSRKPDTLKVYWLQVQLRSKVATLLELLQKTGKNQKIIVYFSSCAAVQYFAPVFKQLLNDGAPDAQKWSIFSLHGKLFPKQRETNLDHFTTSQGGLLFTTDIASRGLDIPMVNSVIQFDAPTDPRNFAHRCGRTARLGAKGIAIVLLTKYETTYVQIQQLRGIPMKKYKGSLENCDDEAVTALLKRIRSLLQKDRQLYLRSIQAVVSDVRAYVAHELSLVFKIHKLKIIELIEGYGCLHVPRMPEVWHQIVKEAARPGDGEEEKKKGPTKEDLDPEKIPTLIFDDSVPFDDIPFLDPEQEAERQRELLDGKISDKKMQAQERKKKMMRKRMKEERREEEKEIKRRKIIEQWEENIRTMANGKESTILQQ